MVKILGLGRKKLPDLTMAEYAALSEEEKKKYTLFRRSARGGPNMPKRQPCPECRRQCPRGLKTKDVATYYCKKCNYHLSVRAGIKK